MNSRYHSHRTSFIPVLLPVVFLILILCGTNGSVYGQWKPHVVDSSIAYYYVSSGYDFENDGDMDIFVAGFESSNIFFYEKQANLLWTKHIIDNDAASVIAFDTADFDRDGHTDFAADNYGADLIAWYRNSGTIPIQWIKDTIDSSIAGPSGVRVADINGDDAMDIVSKAYDSGEMVWYANNLPNDWSKYIIGSDAVGSGMYNVADFNNDNKPDIIRSITLLDKVVLYWNNLPDHAWTEEEIDGNLLSTRHAHAADIDSDGNMDIVAGAQMGLNGAQDIVWYENEGAGEYWTKHIIESDMDGARGLAIVDMNGDGYQDVVATDPGANDVFLFYNEDGGKGWVKHTIDDDFTNANSVSSYDVDMDGDFDIIPSRDATGPLVWYENPFPSAYADSLGASPYLIQSQDDTLMVKARMYNPDNHPVHVFAIIKGDQSDLADTLQLFDDGMHGDSMPSDHIWANSTLAIGLPEDEFEVDLFTYDSTYGNTIGFVTPARFITFGPVAYCNYSFAPGFPYKDYVPFPDARLNLKLTLKNQSSLATATNIATNLASLDTLVSFKNSISSFEDIPAGDSLVSNSKYNILISKECPVGKEIPIEVNISCNGTVCWRDTFSITVVQEPTAFIDEVKTHKVRIYPNPTNELLTLETDNPEWNSIVITSLNGQQIFVGEMEGTTHQIDLSTFQKGVYFIAIRSKDFVTTKKIIKL